MDASAPSGRHPGQSPDRSARPLPARLYRMFIPARPIHVAVFGAAAIAANLLGWLDADTAMLAGFIPIIALLVFTITLDFTRPASYTTPRC